MKRHTGLLLATLALPLSLAACGDDGGTAEGTASDPTEGTDPTEGDGTESGGAAGCVDPSDTAAPRVAISSDIEGDATWTCDNIYVLDGVAVFVRNGTLTIEPGTTVMGTGSSALVIDRSARIEAVGTADAPIVMTSVLPEGQRNRGDWGGLVLIGEAPANVGTGAAEGFPTPPPYGGSDPAHDCGALSYVRVEWAGFELTAGNELNGITFYACGSETSVDHVQVHMGSDDGIEMFGGGFGASHLVVTGAADDSLDIDEGFQGTLQYVFIQQDPTVGDNCLEWSNQASNFTAEPPTHPSVANLTCIGSGSGGEKSKGLTLKEGTEGAVLNSLFANLTNEAVVLLHQTTQDNAETGRIAFDGVHFCGANTFAVGAEAEEVVAWTAEELETWVLGAGVNGNGTDCALPDLTWGAPDVQPPAGSAPDGAGATLPSGFEATTYAGAIDPNGERWIAEPWIALGV
jgi:hypothetical protein